MKVVSRNYKRLHRKRRIRSKIIGDTQRPRLSVFRSGVAFYAQLIDDVSGRTLAAVDSRKSEKYDCDSLKELGRKFAKLILDKKIKNIVYDRSGYLYHGKVKAFAEGLREGGLVF